MTQIPSDETSPDPVTAGGVAQLAAAVDGVGEQVRTLNEKVVPRLERQTRRHRRLILFLYISFTLDIILTIGIGLAVNYARHAAASEAAVCQMWQYLIDLPPAKGTPPRTPDQQRQLVQFEGDLHAQFGCRFGR